MATHIWVNIASCKGLLLTATSHYLNQCWLIICKVVQHFLTAITNSSLCLQMTKYRSVLCHQQAQWSLYDWTCCTEILKREYNFTNSIIRSRGISGANRLRPSQDGRNFTDNILKYIFLNENVWISIKISLKFVLKVRISNISALVQIMAWCRLGDKPLSETVMVSVLTHLRATRPQWV